MLGFDAETGLLVAEAGVLLRDVVATFAPRGWFPPVTPGTQFVTLGGMAACDVHGKNHHGAGSVSRHIAWLDLLLADGREVRCSPTEDAELFWATCGGMGLTGVILRLALRLKPIETGEIVQTTFAAPDLGTAMTIFEAHRDATYSVAWIDCLASGGALGRSLVYLGEHARRHDLPAGADPGRRTPRRPRRVPVDFPGFALNRLSVAAFNALYYARGRPGTELVDLQTYFYPLDGLLEWNRIYGPSGFVQHQCVLPPESARAGLTALLTRISARGAGSFLAVLKLLGEGAGPLSFPMPGYTLALDFPATAANFSLLTELDAVVADHGGRIYLAKDARAGVSALAGYELPRFRRVRDRVDPDRRFRSLQSERLGL
jgi:decaprenylphospho-beta-D-ribofuranose 2-oxidase